MGAVREVVVNQELSYAMDALKDFVCYNEML